MKEVDFIIIDSDSVQLIGIVPGMVAESIHFMRVSGLFVFNFSILFFLFFLNWKIIALQCCVDFCHTKT